MNDSTRFLRQSLRLDGIASGLTGALLLGGAGPISALIGLSTPSVARVIGAGLVLYAAALVWNAGRARVSHAETVAAVVLNAAWVLGAVLGFAILEIVGLRRLEEVAT